MGLRILPNSLLQTRYPFRLAKEKAQCEKEIASMAAKLSNEGFVNKAPAHIVEDMRQKHAAAAEKLAKIEESIRNLG